jgi:hypothetical protein
MTGAPIEKTWNFAESLGTQTVVEMPFSETAVIPRHLNIRELHTFLTKIAMTEVMDPKTPPPKAADNKGRSAQKFVLEVIVKRGSEQRSAYCRGNDAYATWHRWRVKLRSG